MSHQMETKFAAGSVSIQRKLLGLLLLVAVVPIIIQSTSAMTGLFQTPAMIASAALQLAGLIVGFVLVSSVARQCKSIGQTLARINNGDFEARAKSLTNDELGAAAAALNSMCDNTLNLIQSNNERDQIQESIEKLVCEMEGIAAGDLTITTEVSLDVTGAISTSVNQMTEQLRMIVKKVKVAAQQVTNSSVRIREASTEMSEDTDAQASRIGEASSQLVKMTGSFQEVAALTKESVQVAIEARQTASNGLKAVSDTVDGMQRIRDQVQSTSKRIKRLGESSQEIGEIVQLISDITDRTSILALNASIQAAMAGDAGQGFAVVAEEIERLAESSKDATQQISKLIRAIQNETGEVIMDMEESTREVVAGSELASKAGVTLFEIDSVSNQLVELIQNSSDYVLEQSDTATKVADTMSEISQSTKASADKSREATQSVGRLAEMVSQLRDSVSQFKVEDVQERLFPNEPKSFANAEQPSHAGQQLRAAQPEKTLPAGRQMPASATAAKSSNEDKRVAQTMVIREENPHVDDGQGPDQRSAKAIDDQLLRQLQEAQDLLNQSNSLTNPTPANENAMRQPTRTIMLDDPS